MTEYSFPPKLRLLSSKDYQQVFDKPDCKIHSKELLILGRYNNLDHPRLGLVIAKKNCRQAVQRNRVKRYIRETFRLQQARLGGVDLIVLAKPGLSGLDNSSLQRVLNKQWQRLPKQTNQEPG
jgi:ribonuclease P protein component